MSQIFVPGAAHESFDSAEVEGRCAACLLDLKQGRAVALIVACGRRVELERTKQRRGILTVGGNYRKVIEPVWHGKADRARDVAGCGISGRRHAIGEIKRRLG